jgi:hypothetical protein
MNLLADMIPVSVSGLFLGLGIVLGIALTFLLIHRLGRSFFKRMDLEDRGPWDQPLAAPIPKDTVVAVYKRRKRYHRHHRDHYQHRRRGTVRIDKRSCEGES